jgi:hypothetical protein
MRPLVSALLLGACALVSVGHGIRAQGLPSTLTVTSASPSVDQTDTTIVTQGSVVVNSGSSLTFHAGSSITLQNGFQAAAGSNFTAFIAQPDFVITVTPMSATVLAGNGASYTVTVTSLFNFAGTVSFSPAAVSGLTRGASASFSASSITPPANGSGSITLTISTATGVTGNFSFSVSGSSPGYLNHYAAGALSVQDFYLTLRLPLDCYLPDNCNRGQRFQRVHRSWNQRRSVDQNAFPIANPAWNKH